MLINEYLEDSLAEKIDYLLKTTRLTLSEVLKNSINLYYELTRISPADKLNAFGENLALLAVVKAMPIFQSITKMT
ncbi:MAG: hypothetical protein ONB44_23895 [candidate division KSB1 bacterium]|nr:hypothetical protein [candidate division KSB1 bacterium]MDZ7305184.1 hypothetical protein [candidate division KSB1 bacterium]MDZ7314266.1 hypothetical protein [candidate division KSB1 bacterium]